MKWFTDEGTNRFLVALERQENKGIVFLGELYIRWMLQSTIDRENGVKDPLAVY